MLPRARDRAGGTRALIAVSRDADGTLRLRGERLAPHRETLVALLDDAAQRAPDRPFLVERDARDVWRSITFADAARRARCIAAGLRALGADAARPVAILSGNGIDHALVAFGAWCAGVAVVPVTAAAGRSAHDRFARLREIAALVRPSVVFAADGAAYAAAARAVFAELPFVSASEPPAPVRAIDLRRLEAYAPAADAPIGADTTAKIVFTSGSTGVPKGAIVTHGMVAAMLQGIAQAWPFLDGEPPVMADWLPWSHCFGGNKVFGIALRHAGTLYIDDGAPVPARYERTVGLRRTVAPTVAFDVPLGWTQWVARLRADDALRRHWLSRLRLASWGGATLAPATRDALRAIGVPLAAGWGATETSPTVTLSAGIDAAHDAVGVPIAGVELKLLPAAGAYEVRVRGPQVTPGYYWRQDLTAAAFDEEGFYRIGDVLRPVDPRAPERGLAFVARLDERFKLASGAWVQANELRDAFLAACPAAADALVTGEGAESPGILVWLCDDARHWDRALVRAQVAQALRTVAIGGGSAGRLSRALVVDAPIAAGDRTEKGTLVRAAVLARLRTERARLHASLPDDEVIRA